MLSVSTEGARGTTRAALLAVQVLSRSARGRAPPGTVLARRRVLDQSAPRRDGRLLASVVEVLDRHPGRLGIAVRPRPLQLGLPPARGRDAGLRAPTNGPRPSKLRHGGAPGSAEDPQTAEPGQRANSVARDSRTTVMRIWPG